jgi:hypothetical protein
MRFEGGRYICARCGAVLDIAASTRPQVSMHGASGQPNVRIISVKGKEIHRCSYDDAPGNELPSR